LSSGLKNFFDGKGDLLTSLRSGLRDAVIGGIIDATLKGAFIKGALGKLLDGLSNAIATGADPTEWINKIGEALPGIASTVETTLGPLKDVINKAFGYTPETSSSSTSTGSTTTGSTGSSSNGITVNGAGGVSIAIDATTMAFANVFNTASIRFDSSTIRFDASVTRMETFLDRMFVQNGISRSARRGY
jgi:hypothetical protein